MHDFPMTTAVDMDPERVVPVHKVTDNAKLDSLVSDMRRDGWVGRPLLAVDNGDDGVVAMTGSHRVAAARAAGIQVPVVVLPQEGGLELRLSYPHGWEVFFDGERLFEDEVRHAAMQRLGNADAARLMAIELEKNEG